MSIKLTPPLMNSRKAHLTALLSAALETPGGDSIVSPPAKSERSTTDHPSMSSALESSQPLAIGQPPSAALLESQLPSGNLARLSVLKPSISIPELSSSSPETMPSMGTIQVGETIYDIMAILFSSTGFLGRGMVCYLVRRDGEFYVIKDHWVQNELKRYQNPLQEVNMMKLVQGIDSVPVLVDFWMVEVLPGVPDVTQRYRQEKWWRNMISTQTHIRLIMKPYACPLTMFRTKKELVSCLMGILKSMFMICDAYTKPIFTSINSPMGGSGTEGCATPRL